MNVQKLKEALVAARNQMENDIISIDNDADIFEMVQQNDMPEAWGMVVKALAELEDTVDVKTYYIDENGIADHCATRYVLLADAQSYAESYHSKKCDGIADRITKAWRENGEDVTLRILRDAILGE